MNNWLIHRLLVIPIVSHGNNSQTSSDHPIMKSPMPGKLLN